MVKISLALCATLENVKEIQTSGDDFRWYLKLRCNNCGEVSNTWQYINLIETTELKGGRGFASMVQKCKMCSRENNIDILKDEIASYKDDSDGQFAIVVVFECRGIEPVEFDFRNGWKVLSSLSPAIFEDVDLSEKEWYDYDSIANQSIGITELNYQICKFKK